MSDDKNSIKLFESQEIRAKWDDEIEDYYFSVIDVIAVLTDSNKPRDYWYRLKKRELENGVDLSTNCRHLKMPAKDGKLRETDVANTKDLFRIIQSIPSKKAEPK